MSVKPKSIVAKCGDGNICQVHGFDTNSEVVVPSGANQTAFISMLEEELSQLLRLNTHIRVGLTNSFGNFIGPCFGTSGPIPCGAINFLK